MLKVFSKETKEQLNITSRRKIIEILQPVQNELELETDLFKSLLEKYKDAKLQPNEFYYNANKEYCDKLARENQECYETKKETIYNEKTNTYETKIVAKPYTFSTYMKEKYILNPTLLKELAPFKVVGFDDEIEEHHFDTTINDELYAKFMASDTKMMKTLNLIHPTCHFEK